MDSVRFQAAVARALLRDADGGGIGMLGEKTLHSALKYYYEPDATRHEQAEAGFLADIKNEDGVTEIQTGSLFALNRKLDKYLPDTPVTVVHPVVRRRKLIYRDPETGELNSGRLSPKTGTILTAFSGLVHILSQLKKEGLVIAVPIVDAEEYRVKTGEKRRRGRPDVIKYELVPTELVDEWVFVTPSDWLRVLPEGLPTPFTAKELAAGLSCRIGEAQSVCAVLTAAGALEREKRGRAYEYRLAAGTEEE